MATIIPDILGQDIKLTVDLGISFDRPIYSGTTITPADAADPPKIFITGGNTDASYAILLLDPDAPSRVDPQFSMWRHWIQTGLRIGDAQLTSSVPPYTPYLGPGPKPGTGFHRYIFLLVQGPADIRPAPLGNEFVDRRCFKALEWIEVNGCQIVGATSFLCRNIEDDRLDIK